jgi:hypothetical protein
MVDFLNLSNRQEKAKDMVRARQGEMFCMLLSIHKPDHTQKPFQYVLKPSTQMPTFDNYHATWNESIPFLVEILY